MTGSNLNIAIEKFIIYKQAIDLIQNNPKKLPPKKHKKEFLNLLSSLTNSQEERKKVACIRVLSKTKKKKILELLFNIAQFKNLLILFINVYKQAYGTYPTDISFLYAMLSEKDYSTKDKGKKKDFDEFSNNIKNSEETKKWLENLKEQKKIIDNNYLLQTIIKQVSLSYKSYFRALSGYQKNPSKYTGKPKPPKVKKLKKLPSFSVEFNEFCLELDFTRLILKLKIVEKVYINIALGQEVWGKEIKSARLFFIGTDCYVHVVYTDTDPIEKAKAEHIASIDVGLDNLLAVFSDNPQLNSFIVSGKELKAFNQWFNKKKSQLTSKIKKLYNQKTKTKKDLEQIVKIDQELKRLSALRKRFFDNELHKISRRLVDILYQTGHHKIYIGKGGTDSKQNINLGKKNNQHFVSIPFRKLIDLIIYKAAKLGMKVKEIDEHYTSKSSSISDDIIDIQKKLKDRKSKASDFHGKRIHRGLYHDKKINKVFNADMNGALNILKVGALLHKIKLSDKAILFKLANPIKFKLMNFYYKSIQQIFG